jgi:hypothetical protein
MLAELIVGVNAAMGPNSADVEVAVPALFVAVAVTVILEPISASTRV